MLWILPLMLLIVLVFIAAIASMRGQDKEDDTGRYPSPGIYRRQHVNRLRHH
jgi:hypothetical protein